MITPAALLTLSMQCAPSIHPDTTYDIAKVESALNPYAIGVVGQKGMFPKTIDDALAHVARLKAQGKNYSVGLMQINKSNFSRYGVTPEQLFDPCTNLKVFEKIITNCYKRGKTLKRALSCYYSGNFNTGQKPEAAFAQTSYTQRIGYKPSLSTKYVVPSTKADQIKQTAPSPGKPITPHIRYPNKVIRGNFIITQSN